ncbi:MAG: hypothetical protein [Arizlama microvirus]|nr:MAG: hypothetical protein [Arizlama microvirus]
MTLSFEKIDKLIEKLWGKAEATIETTSLLESVMSGTVHYLDNKVPSDTKTEGGEQLCLNLVEK